MVRGEQGVALRHVRMLFEVGTTGGLTDGQLLEEFRSRAGDRTELAFAALVARHGPMVLRTCRAILPTSRRWKTRFKRHSWCWFAGLARSGSRDSLGPWLHQVAQRVAQLGRAAEISPPPARATEGRAD